MHQGKREPIQWSQMSQYEIFLSVVSNLVMSAASCHPGAPLCSSFAVCCPLSPAVQAGIRDLD